MLKNLIETSLEIVDKQNWISEVTKLQVRENIQHVHRQIAYSDLIDESVASNSLNKEMTNDQSDHFKLTKYESEI